MDSWWLNFPSVLMTDLVGMENVMATTYDNKMWHLPIPVKMRVDLMQCIYLEDDGVFGDRSFGFYGWKLSNDVNGGCSTNDVNVPTAVVVVTKGFRSVRGGYGTDWCRCTYGCCCCTHWINRSCTRFPLPGKRLRWAYSRLLVPFLNSNTEGNYLFRRLLWLDTYWIGLQRLILVPLFCDQTSIEIAGHCW